MSMSYGMNIPTFRSAFMDYNYTKHQRQEMDVKSTKYPPSSKCIEIEKQQSFVFKASKPFLADCFGLG